MGQQVGVKALVIDKPRSSVLGCLGLMLEENPWLWGSRPCSMASWPWLWGLFPRCQGIAEILGHWPWASVVGSCLHGFRLGCGASAIGPGLWELGDVLGLGLSQAMAREEKK
jgi:hypothetical protein